MSKLQSIAAAINTPLRGANQGMLDVLSDFGTAAGTA